MTYDAHTLAKRAKSAAAQGHFAEAVQLYRQLVGDPNAVDSGYDGWVRGLAQSLAALNRRRQAAYLHLFLQEFDPALELLANGDPVDRARVLDQKGMRLHAAEIYAGAGKLVHAAIAYEKAGDATIPPESKPSCERCEAPRMPGLLICVRCGQHVQPGDPQMLESTYGAARKCWDRLRTGGKLRDRPYEAALVAFNLGTLSLKLGDEAGLGHLVTAQHLLEEAADGFETIGQRERAFDCYQILLEMGRRSGAFENLAEGFINCIRILKEDNLKYYVLQFYEDFVREALAHKEFHAAATLYRECADYCLRTAMIYDRHYMALAAKAWLQAGEKIVLDGGSAEMAENAGLAAVECFNAIGDYPRVGQTYAMIASLDLSTRRQERYQRIVERYAGAADEQAHPPEVPKYLRQVQSYPDVWYLDMIEWENEGEPIGVCSAVIGDVQYPDFVRRRAVNLVVDICEGLATHPGGLAEVAERLGDLQIYVVFSVIERLFEQGDAAVQRGVMRATRNLFFKRSFVTLSRGLVSPDSGVRAAAIEALTKLYFAHAFDPLVRIFREMDDPEIRLAAVRSIGHIPTLPAADFLVEVLRYESGPLREEAKRLLMTYRKREILPVLRQHYEMETGQIRADLEEILRASGGLRPGAF